MKVYILTVKDRISLRVFSTLGRAKDAAISWVKDHVLNDEEITEIEINHLRGCDYFCWYSENDYVRVTHHEVEE